MHHTTCTVHLTSTSDLIDGFSLALVQPRHQLPLEGLKHVSIRTGELVLERERGEERRERRWGGEGGAIEFALDNIQSKSEMDTNN